MFLNQSVDKDQYSFNFKKIFMGHFKKGLTQSDFVFFFDLL
jgi:hypothetical protein